ncbi:antibiotic biosynthesis monooxygenase [Pseudomonas sp. UYIF39]|uniref:antibiotic biosynthesis monooxygenase n=1 Tax=unclassified Pseudomonas TaxID=196821 RepID=UPI001C597575|nr:MULTISPECIES: antibiotic biosynthesis monooxygenase [unclassified Pseudomonas]MDI3357959.1 antibiotic biosynthesis monooxygenase [Pseudomonas sp. UYIF39]
MDKQSSNEPGISVIVHEVSPEYQSLYEEWMERAIDAHRKSPGFLAADVLRPVGSTLRYAVILRFTSREDANRWLTSKVRYKLLEEASPWLLRQDRYRTNSDADFWFEPLNGGDRAKRWKQWLLTWGVVLPLSSVISWLLGAGLSVVDLELPLLLFKLISSALLSLIMVYWAMPTVSRLASRWLLI